MNTTTARRQASDALAHLLATTARLAARRGYTLPAAIQTALGCGTRHATTLAAGGSRYGWDAAEAFNLAHWLGISPVTLLGLDDGEDVPPPDWPRTS